MGFLDKVKQVAGEAADAAKKGASQVQSKVEQGQTRKKADEAAKQLGYLIYKERAENVPSGPEADRLVEEIKGFEQQLAEMQRQAEQQAAAAGNAVDPVCGMSVEVASAQWTSEYEGSTYYFCSQACFDRFTKEPATFATVGDPTPGPMQAEEGSAGE